MVYFLPVDKKQWVSHLQEQSHLLYYKVIPALISNQRLEKLR
jgi:hypothetical protein